MGPPSPLGTRVRGPGVERKSVVCAQTRADVVYGGEPHLDTVPPPPQKIDRGFRSSFPARTTGRYPGLVVWADGVWGVLPTGGRSASCAAVTDGVPAPRVTGTGLGTVLCPLAFGL